MKGYRIELGQEVRDLLTGFQGIVCGRSDYMTGCDQYLVRQAKAKDDGSLPEGNWLDDQRLEIVNTAIHPSVLKVQKATASTGNGADVPAPIK